MSFTMILAVVYAALIGFAVAVLTAVLMYMWIHSPM